MSHGADPTNARGKAPMPASAAGETTAKTLKKRRQTSGKAPVPPAHQTPRALPSHPFAVDYCDHFETPLTAYRDVKPILALLASRLEKSIADLVLWDPFYCAGRARKHLRQLGFNSVVHENRDFYERQKSPPKYDVLVTNPPYSGDHKQRCLAFCVASGKPWLLLMPNYVATKDYFKRTFNCSGAAVAAGPAGSSSSGGAPIGAAGKKRKRPAASATVAAAVVAEPFYVVPRARYEFDHPHGTGHAQSPFDAVWFVHAGTAAATDGCWQALSGSWAGPTRLVRTVAELAAGRLVPTAKRPNPRQRKRAKGGGGNHGARGGGGYVGGGTSDTGFE